MRRLCVLSMIMLLVVSFGAAFAGGGAEEAVEEEVSELLFWDMSWGPDGYEDIAAGITREYEQLTGISISYSLIPWEGNYQRFMTAIASGDTPDVATTSAAYPGSFGPAGHILPLNSVVEQWEAEGKLDEFSEEALTAWQVDGQTYALPWQVDTRGYYYRKDVFEELGLELPTTFDEFIEVAKVIRDETDLIPLATGFRGNWGKHPVMMLQKQNNTGMVDRDGDDLKAIMDSPENLEVLQFIKTLMNERLIPEGALGYDGDDIERLYYDGEAAMLQHGLTEVILNYPDVAENSGVMPIFMGPSADRKMISGFWNPVSVFSNTADPETAMDFAKWYVENNLELFTSGYLPHYPVMSSQLDDPYFSDSWIRLESAEEVIPYIVHETHPIGEYFDAYATLNGENYAALMAHEVLAAGADADLEEIAARLNRQVEEVLDEFR